MTKKATAALVGVGVFLIGATAVACSSPLQGQQTPTPTASQSSSLTSSSTTSPTPTASPMATAPVAATCANISTVGFQALVATNGWVQLDKQAWPNGGHLLVGSPGASPGGGMSCAWAPDGGGGTDNAVSIAWAPIEADDASPAEQKLVAEGGQREDTPVGVYISFSGQGGGDNTYLFTNKDVRWALYTQDLGYIKAPDEDG